MSGLKAPLIEATTKRERCLLNVDNLTKQYGDFTAVAGVSFSTDTGKIFGLLGPNGAGKSTTINCISGLLPPTSGHIAVGGFDIVRDGKKAKSTLGIVPQELALYEDLPAVENLSYWGKAYGLGGTDLKARISEVLDYIGLADRARDLPKTFSGGMKRRLNFGCGIVHKPNVLLLDEPTVGLDPEQVRQFRQLLKEVGRDRTVILSTHILSEVEATCEPSAS